jgi:cellulose synthase/poly-beta-1,6-N-acetylglucosamine synthase-like glycosyltransferase
MHLSLRIGDRQVVVAASSCSDTDKSELRARYGNDCRIDFIPPKLIAQAIEKQSRSYLIDKATTELAREQPAFSASQVITGLQKGLFLFALLIVAAGFFVIPQSAAFGLAAAASLFFLANTLFRAFLLLASGWKARSASHTLHKGDLPHYSIIVPLYQEANVMPCLVRALCALDYPKDRLDILLVVEADDFDTAHAADAAALDQRFTVIRVPPSHPRTKPKACNYALPFARGEFLVIFDAEDRPEPDQLVKAVSAFRSQPFDVACLQARLEFFNLRDGWISLMSALDYLLWFRCLLPGLDRLRIPMPLGGTSNHFRTSALRAIGGWDPYNVTEDADLGIRFSRLGLRVRTLDSTTYEEAVTRSGAWIRQRSRWMKGYMQTWLVHMRDPRGLVKYAGWRGFIGFQLFIGGTFMCALANPVLWTLFLWSHFSGSSEATNSISHVSLSALIAGNGLFAFLATFVPTRRGWFGVVPFGLTAPFYWILISIAAYRALWQLFNNPWHWDKTEHGVSKHTFSGHT